MSVTWTAEKIAALSKKEIESLLENAKTRAPDVAVLCSAELDNRKPERSKVSRTPGFRHGSDEQVIGFHFVCDRGQGVKKNDDGTLWTGTWVVAEVHAARAAKISAYVALHESKAEPSYLQGVIKDFKRSARESSYAEGQEVQTEYGMDFLFEPTSKPYAWVGEGSGEKGYAWAMVDRLST